ncbi:MAG: cytochrome-c peroxidase, partial [Flavobacterium sp.]|nr:cytochrome-c peroxidase [Flavobacterium sp.]
MKKLFVSICMLLGIGITSSCSDSDDTQYVPITPTVSYPNVEAAFGDKLNLNSLSNYANQYIPPYIRKRNGTANPVSNKGATLGRVLFYDTNLSSNNTISCASCHQQSNAFSDTNVASTGVNGTTGRHSMRLINTRFAVESKFFWDERAGSLELQTTMPIKDHGEMGFSGTGGDLSFDDLITRLQGIGYYQELFKFVYGTEVITENRIQLA